jgi:lipopolysaccharide transport system permease protein
MGGSVVVSAATAQMVPRSSTRWYLIRQLARREVVGRYRGSVLGILWSFGHPVLMLLVYMFVFGVVFQVRWGLDIDSPLAFGMILFAGLLVHGFFAECAVRSTALVTGNPNYVKKVVFPLDVLPWMNVLVGLFHFAAGCLVLIVVVMLFHTGITPMVLLVPVVVAPIVVLSIGLGWWLSALTVYVRDVAQVTGILTTVLLFLAPILYPLTAVPEAWRPLMYLNPLTVIVEALRAVVIFGVQPAWLHLGLYTLVAGAVFTGGYWFFQRARRGFPDAL